MLIEVLTALAVMAAIYVGGFLLMRSLKIALSILKIFFLLLLGAVLIGGYYFLKSQGQI